MARDCAAVQGNDEPEVPCLQVYLAAPGDTTGLQVADIVSAIASASGEQSTDIDRVTTALSEVGEITQRNSTLAEQNAEAVSALEQQSQSMAERASLFQLDQDADEAEAPAVHSIKPAAVPSPAVMERRRLAS